MNRRRFLAISAAAYAAPHAAFATTWRGYALGAEVSIDLTGPRLLVDQALAAVPNRLRAIEKLFSLYDPKSAVRALNKAGHLHNPTPAFLDLMQACTQANALTDGLFDPTVQTLWKNRVGVVDWREVNIQSGAIFLGKNQALTFNGIAQGYATDILLEELVGAGFTDRLLVNIGEFRASGGPFRIGIADPAHGIVGTRALKNHALATSSVDSTRFGQRSHIIAPDGRRPRWSTVSVEAGTATLADALSTAAVFMTPKQMRALSAQHSVKFVAITKDGDVSTF